MRTGGTPCPLTSRTACVRPEHTLPTPDSTVGAPTEQQVLAALPSANGEARRLPMPRRRRLVGLAALVAAALLVGGFAGSELAGSTRAATSTPGSGLHARARVDHRRNEPTSPAARPQPAGSDRLGRQRPLRCSGPGDRVAASTAPESAARRHRHLGGWPRRRPLQQAGANRQAAVPGRGHDSGPQQTPQRTPLRRPTTTRVSPHQTCPLYWISAPTGPDQDIDISVWMGRNDPTPAMKATADEELARLTLPPS